MQRVRPGHQGRCWSRFGWSDCRRCPAAIALHNRSNRCRRYAPGTWARACGRPKPPDLELRHSSLGGDASALCCRLEGLRQLVSTARARCRAGRSGLHRRLSDQPGCYPRVGCSGSSRCCHRRSASAGGPCVTGCGSCGARRASCNAREGRPEEGNISTTPGSPRRSSWPPGSSGCPMLR